MKNKIKSMVLVLLVVMSLMTVIFTYNRKKVTTKEEYIQEFKIDIVQFEQACNNVLNQVDHKNVNQVKAINGKQELMKLGIENNFLQKYGIECASITVKNGDIFVTFEFSEKIEGYESAGSFNVKLTLNL